MIKSTTRLSKVDWILFSTEASVDTSAKSQKLRHKRCQPVPIEAVKMDTAVTVPSIECATLIIKAANRVVQIFEALQK